MPRRSFKFSRDISKGYTCPLINTYVLVPLDIVYMQTIVFILVIAALVQMVEIILKKVSPSLYQALGMKASVF